MGLALHNQVAKAETLDAATFYARTVTSGTPLDFDFAIDEAQTEVTVFVGSCQPKDLTLTVSGEALSSPTFKDFFIQKRVKSDTTLTFSVSTLEDSIPFNIVVALKTKPNAANITTEKDAVYLIPNNTVTTDFAAVLSYYRLSNGDCNPVNSLTRSVGLDNNIAIILDGFAPNQTMSVAASALDPTGALVTFPPVEAQTQILECTLPEGLTFCDIDYAVPGSSADITALDTTAQDQYTMFLQVLSQYNCWEEQISYSYMVTCSDCRVAYKNWLCRTRFHKCVPYEAQPDRTGDDKYYELPCWSVCYNTLQGCPFNLGFECPVNFKFESFTRSYRLCPTDYGYSDAPAILPSALVSILLVGVVMAAAFFV